MDWMTPSTLKRRGRKKRTDFGKSISEPNLLGHFTPRFPDNLTHLLHEYVTVDELKFYRKRRPPNIDNEFHNKDSICLYDKNQPVLPFAALKTEYTREFGKTHSLRSRSVPNKFDLNATTKELLDALRYDLCDYTRTRTKRATTANISGEIEIEDGDELLKDRNGTDPSPSVTKSSESTSKSNEESPPDYRRKCMFKVQGEVTYQPDLSGEFKGIMERSESIPRLNNIKFHGKFHGDPEYRDNYKTYNHFTKSAPIKARDHLRVSPITANTAIVSPTVSSLSEYTDKYKEIDLRSAERRKMSKQISNVAMRNNLMIGHSDAHVFPEYFETFQDPNVRKPPEKGKPRSPILGLNGNMLMDYNPEYRVKFTEHPRRRPVLQRPESHFDFYERPRKLSPIRSAIISPKFNRKIAVIEPSQNIHQPPTIDKNPFYLCQPEVRKARREVLIKKRPPSPRQTLSAAIRCGGRTVKLNEDEENQRYNDRSRIVTSPIKTPLLMVDDFDEPTTKPTTLVQVQSPTKYGRRVSMQTNNNVHAKRNSTKIIEGNYQYSRKKSSLTSSTEDELGNGGSRKLVNSQSLESPSFVVLKDPIKQNKWMKSTWYL